VRKIGVVSLAALATAVALVASGCGADRAGQPAAKAADKRCPARALAGWQRLANRIRAPVYCPAWMPDPFDSVIRGQWNTIDSVSPPSAAGLGWPWSSAGEGFKNLFDACAAAPSCASKYGDVRTKFADKVREFEAHPLTVTGHYAEGGPPVQVVLDGGARLKIVQGAVR